MAVPELRFCLFAPKLYFSLFHMDARNAALLHSLAAIDSGGNLPFKCLFDENIGMWASNCLFLCDLERVRRCFRSWVFYELLSVSSWKWDEENKSLLYVFRFLYRLIKENNLYTTLVLSSQMFSDFSLLCNFAKPMSAFLLKKNKIKKVPVCFDTCKTLALVY